jgi:hypothetical protein
MRVMRCVKWQSPPGELTASADFSASGSHEAEDDARDEVNARAVDQSSIVEEAAALASSMVRSPVASCSALAREPEVNVECCAFGWVLRRSIRQSDAPHAADRREPPIYAEIRKSVV